MLYTLRKPLIIHFFLIILVWLLPGLNTVLAQRSGVQGIITDNETGQALFGANIVLKSLTDEDEIFGEAADADGFYRIDSIKPGTYSLRISYIGYRTYTDTLEFIENENRTVSVALQPDDSVMDEVVVKGVAGAAWKEEGRQRITPVDLGRIPSPATGDLATYMQTLPGVVSLGDRGGQVYIRGGTPSQNLVLVDGAMIFRPTHIVGFFSPFPQNLVAGVDFYAGGFGPRYNSRISSVMDIQMRHGDRFKTTGSASISPFAAEITAEGPINEGSSSWIVSVRNSLIEQTSSWYPIEEQPFKFGSQFLKTSLINKNARCSASLMHTYDRGQVDFEINESIKWQNLVFGGRCVALPEGSKTLLDTNVNISTFTNSKVNVDGFGFSSNIWRINLDMNLRQYVGQVRFDYGIFARLKSMGYDMEEPFLSLDNEHFSQFVGGAHFETSIPVGERLNLRPGVAVTLYPGEFPASIEPRFRFSWQPFGTETEEVTGAVGLYRQSVVGVSDMRDASSVFVAWMKPPLSESQMEALHATLGWQQQVANGLTWSVEGFYKRMRDQPVPVWNTIARFTTDLSLADGEVYGGDLRLEYNSRYFYGMLGYGYSWTLYTAAQDHFNVWFGEPIQKYHPPHDRRHQLNGLLSLEIGSFTTSLRWQYGTGVPYTRPIGFDDILDFRERLPDVNRDQGQRRVILDKPYGGRLPAVHRLDLSVERTFLINESTSLNVTGGAVNLYNQKNIFYYDVYTHRRINQLPVVPYLTLTMEM